MTIAPQSPNDTPPDASKRPRRSWTIAEQTAYVADFAASGLSATAFCRRLGIRRATLARWRQRAAVGATPRRVAHQIARSGAGGVAAVTVVPDIAHAARAAAPSTASAAPLALVLRVRSGVVADVAGLDVTTAAALLRAVLMPATAGVA
ncbi:MAG TPA: transposase [Gemmatirosa sp.]